MCNLHIFKEDGNEDKDSYLDWSASKWRDLFLEHYFTSTEDNFPVTYLSITEINLAQLAGESSDQANKVFQAFRLRLPKDLNELEKIFRLYDKYERSASVISSSNVRLITDDPHHFLLLMFSCLVACTDPGSTNRKSQYPERMQSLLGFSKTPQKISGLAAMWRAFKVYLDVRYKANSQSRRLELPHPGNETRIGYAKRLAFPEMRDRRKVREILKNIDSDLVTPDWVSNKFTNVEVINYSESFKKAHREFEDFLTRGGYGAQIKQTKFYEAIKALAVEEHFDIDIREYYSVIIDLFYDLNGSPYIEVISGRERSTISSWTNESLNLQWLFDIGESDPEYLDPELLRAMKKGVLFFSFLSVAQWRWSSNPDKDSDLRILVDQTQIKISPLFKHNSYLLFDNWILLAINRHNVSDFLDTISEIIKQLDSAIRLIGAARVGLGYLLNNVSEIGVSAVNAKAVSYCGKEKDWINLNQYQENLWGPLHAEKGSVLVRVSADNGLYRHRKFQAHKMALPHANLATPEKNKHLVGIGNLQKVDNRLADVPAMGQLENKLSDLLEVIYAEGRHGLTEFELIGWIRRAYPKCTVSWWYVLQSLLDSGWLNESYRLHWPVRTFFLRPLICIHQFISEDRCRLHFEGALPMALRSRIERVLNDNGVEISIGNSLSSFAPPPLFVDLPNNNVRAIANSLNAQIVKMQLFSMPEIPIELKATMAVHRTWCWSKRRFIESAEVVIDEINGVRLDKLRFKAQHGMDRYQVSLDGNVSQYYFPQVAIRVAYLKAREPLFELSSGKLINLAHYSAISAELARFWRLQTLTSSGPVKSGAEGFRYVYSCPDERLLSQCLNLKNLIATDLQEIPFWLKACTFQSIADGGQVLLCNEMGLVSPEMKFIR